MISRSMGRDVGMNKNEFIANIIRDARKCHEYTSIILDDYFWYENNCHGKIDETLLLELIDKSQTKPRLAKFLDVFSIHFKSEDITWKIFGRLLRFKRTRKDSILTGLAHCPLSHSQLLILNKLKYPEALCQLLFMYMNHECFTPYDLEYLLEPWGGKIPELIADVFEKYASVEKIKNILIKGKDMMGGLRSSPQGQQGRS